MTKCKTNELILEVEAKIIRRMLRTAKGNGWNFSVYEGEELAIGINCDVEETIKALGSTGEDWIRFYDNNGVKLGFVYVIYNNGNDGLDLITDHSLDDEGPFEMFMDDISNYVDTLN